MQTLDDGVDPLGPLSAPKQAVVEVEEPPEPPLKESEPRPRSSLLGQATSSGLNSNSLGFEDEQETSAGGAREPPPVQSSTSDGSKRQTQPSVSVEQAAKPSFNITVGDPHKVGDYTGSHTVYQVRTQVSSSVRVDLDAC